MTTTREAFEAGIDAVLADNSLNKAGFRDAIRTVLTARFSQANATAWIDDALAVEFNRALYINNPTYNNLRGFIVNQGKDNALLAWDILERFINGYPESQVADTSAVLISLREERDNIDAAIDRLQALIDAEPAGAVGRIVKEQLREDKQTLRDRKQDVRNAIQALTGDPDN